MVPSPTLMHSSWRHLLREITNHSQFRALSSNASSQLELALVMPAAIARWIERFRPELKSRQSLHIVVAGAEWGPDCVDDGRWYQMLPTLLGRPELAVKVTLVGPNIGATTRPGAPPTHMLPVASVSPSYTKKWAPAETFCGTLGQYLRERGTAGLDLAILSHPGFELHADQWLKTDEVGAVLTAKIPVGVFCYDIAEYEHEAWILNEHGYAVKGEPDRNPFRVDEPEAQVPSATCDMLWELESQVPASDAGPSAASIERLRAFAQWSGALVHHGYIPDDNERGQVLVVPGLGEMVAIPVHLWVSLATGAIFADQAGELQALRAEPLPAEILAKFPRTSPFQFDRTLWVSEVSGYLRTVLDAEVFRGLIEQL